MTRLRTAAAIFFAAVLLAAVVLGIGTWALNAALGIDAVDTRVSTLLAVFVGSFLGGLAGGLAALIYLAVVTARQRRNAYLSGRPTPLAPHGSVVETPPAPVSTFDPGDYAPARPHHFSEDLSVDDVDPR